MRYGCIGKSLGHSFSALLHGYLGDEDYRLVELPEEALAPFFEERDFEGINVTIPYKERVIPYLDEIDTTARAIGAVNTVIKRDGRLFGYNTDAEGLRALLRHAGITLSDKCVAILGTGGTSRTAMAVAKALGAKEILLVSRVKSDTAIDYAELTGRGVTVDVIINTTPVGMYPNTDTSPICLDAFPNLSGVIDVVYNPLRTRLVLDAMARNIPAEGGLYMLVAQGVRARELFLDTKLGEDVCERVYKRLFKEKLSLALVGMPSSGKSTVGQRLAEMLDIPFVDTDALAEQKIGMSPADFIRRYGEPAFRKIEGEVIKEVTAEAERRVIATGGGAVLNRENVNNLLQNSRIYFLDRPLCMLEATENRPLSSTEEALRQLYAERYEIYQGCADVKIDASGDADRVAELIRKELLQ